MSFFKKKEIKNKCQYETRTKNLTTFHSAKEHQFGKWSNPIKLKDRQIISRESSHYQERRCIECNYAEHRPL